MNEHLNETSSNHHEERRQRREARRALRGGGEWMGGAVLVLIGLLLLGQNLKIASFDNWWAFFILFPAFGSFGAAWRMSQAAGRFTMRARSAAILGVVLTLVTAIFLLDLNWTTLGPALLILAGIGLLVNALLPD